MSKLTAEDIGIIASAASKAALETIEAERRRANERVYGEKAILAELGISRSKFWRLVRLDRLPVDRDPLGLSIRRWDVNRWLDGRRRAVDGADLKARGKNGTR
ncbi:MAG: hypothetical protein HOW73_20515 [Polyangiaceae bacterium]|nr:hypothetical protein [Polyangiaceae bacterium]